MEAYSLLEVNQYIRRVVALNFEDAVWIECEISQLSVSRNNRYLELIEKNPDTDEIVAKASASLWYRQYLFIKKKLGKVSEDVLDSGNKIKIKVTIEFSERYGLSFNILDIDPSYTFGQFELNRQKIIERLETEDLIEKNRQTELQRAVTRIAIISSQTAAGYKDFMAQIQYNNYGYTFDIELFQSAMQGQNTERETLMAFDSIDVKKFDLICIIRGGGSKLDLSAFDNYEIAAKIANSKIPVITGIGHEIDQSVCDIVSHTSLKTPTAVANYIIDHNLEFETEIDNLLYEISNEVDFVLNNKKQLLAAMQSSLLTIPKYVMNEKLIEIKTLQNSAQQLTESHINNKLKDLDSFEKIIELMNPDNVLKRGYALIKSEGKYITRKSQISKKNQELNIEFLDGDIKANTK